MRFKKGSTYTLGYGIGKVRIDSATAKGKTFKATRLSDGKTLNFGDASMPTRQDNPKAKKAYCDRASGLAPRGFNPNTFSLIYWDCIPANPTTTNNDSLSKKAAEYNKDGKYKITAATLQKVYNRGIGAYETNPGSVRDGVTSKEQWAMARVNNFIATLKSGKFKSGSHDTDLLPDSHPKASKKEVKNNMRLTINSTIAKSQIRDTGKNFIVTGIPVTKDNAVMNGIKYPADENAKGMSSIVSKPITGGHPKNDEGFPISANTDLSEWYIGANVTKHYNNGGINYVDVKVSKSMMQNADNELGKYFFKKLSNGESIGVSTGLMLDKIEVNGETVASNQRYDHLAFLHDNEAPAGGKDTVIRFNADADIDVVNFDDFHINEATPAQSALDKLAQKLDTVEQSLKSSYNNQDTNQSEIIMNRDKLLSMFTNMDKTTCPDTGKPLSELSDVELENLTQNKEYMKSTDTKAKKKGDEEDDDKDDKKKGDDKKPAFLKNEAEFDAKVAAEVARQMAANSQKTELQRRKDQLCVNASEAQQKAFNSCETLEQLNTVAAAVGSQTHYPTHMGINSQNNSETDFATNYWGNS